MLEKASAVSSSTTDASGVSLCLELVSDISEPHHILPNSGWVSVWIRGGTDAETVIDLFRLNYDRPWLARRG